MPEGESYATLEDGVQSLHPGRHWHALEDGRIQCDICPRACKLKEGQRGLCFVRARHGDHMVLTTYGRSSGFCIDPIEKKPLNHFLPGTPVLSFGTAGCNLTCRFCQNWDISKARDFDRLQNQAGPETIAAAALKTGSRSVAYTYNDPTIFFEYAIDVAQACRAKGIKNVAVTAGYISAEPRAEFYRWMDAANVDLKAFTESFYQRLCSAHLEAVKETLVYLVKETKVWVEITTLVIPGENDGETELNELAAWVVEALGPDVPLHFSAFHPDYKMLDLPRTPLATLVKARDIAIRHGVRYAYVGNVHYPPGDGTYCPGCGTEVIGRDWYEITAWRLTPDGHCRKCGTACAGIFDGPPGKWGRKRVPVRL
ncbi:MAG: AmmeMemoRadiSam system radical SAM enzyme [Magnetospirillum sp. WYHS-4]